MEQDLKLVIFSPAGLLGYKHMDLLYLPMILLSWVMDLFLVLFQDNSSKIQANSTSVGNGTCILLQDNSIKASLIHFQKENTRPSTMVPANKSTHNFFLLQPTTGNVPKIPMNIHNDLPTTGNYFVNECK